MLSPALSRACYSMQCVRAGARRERLSRCACSALESSHAEFSEGSVRKCGEVRRSAEKCGEVRRSAEKCGEVLWCARESRPLVAPLVQLLNDAPDHVSIAWVFSHSYIRFRSIKHDARK